MAVADRRVGMVSPITTLAKRFANFTPSNIQAGIIELWDVLIGTHPRHAYKPDARSRSRALHVGVWECSSSLPMITAESRNQKPSTILALDNLLLYLKEHIISKVNNRMLYEFPDMYDRGVQ